jgi:hypothetical protein
MRIPTFCITASLLFAMASPCVAQQTPQIDAPPPAASPPPALSPPPPALSPPPPFAQPATPGPVQSAAAAPESALLPNPRTGRSQVGKDGISTETVRAVPCSAFARETDGFTTCIGIPESGADFKRKRRR